MDEAIAEYRAAIRVQPDHVKAHHGLGWALERQGKLDEAIAEYRTDIRIQPDYAWAHNSLAWALAKPPDRGSRARSEALEHARQAVALSPKEGTFHNTLALAEYRIGHWGESIAAAERSIALLKGVDAANWFFLAMALWQRGEKNPSRSFFDQAVAWTKKNDPRNAELLAFWRESAELLGQPGPGRRAVARSARRRVRAMRSSGEWSNIPDSKTKVGQRSEGDILNSGRRLRNLGSILNRSAKGKFYSDRFEHLY